MKDDRQGRCGRCEHCLIDIDTDKGVARARCTLIPGAKVKGKHLGVEKQYYAISVSIEKAAEMVKDKCDRGVSPVWCPLDKEEA